MGGGGGQDFPRVSACKQYCCIRRDGTRYDSECAFIYSDIMVNISQVTPVIIQNKNHLEIIQIITFK